MKNILSLILTAICILTACSGENKETETAVSSLTMNQPSVELLVGETIQLSANRLAISQAPIADIASACGFQDISYFTKIFREMKGSTPKEYYRLHNQTQSIRPSGK